MHTADEVATAFATLLSFPPEEIAAKLEQLGRENPNAAVRVEAALQLLAADEADLPFWSAVIGGHQGAPQ